MCHPSAASPPRRRLALLLLVGGALFAVCAAADDYSPPSPTTSTPVDPIVLSMLERTLLTKMGMKERPRPKRFNVPQPLVDMYERLQRVDDDDGLLLVDHDSAIGFWPEPVVVDKNLDSTEHDDDEDATVFRFRLDGLRQSDHLEAAELRLYLRATEPRQPGQARLQLFEIVRNHSVLLDSTSVRCDGDQQFVSAALDATIAAMRWRRMANDSTAAQGTLVLRAAGQKCAVEVEGHTSHSPVLIAFTTDVESDDAADPNDVRDDGAVRVRRSANGRRHNSRRRGRHGPPAHPHSPAERHLIRSHENLCRRKELKIVVSEIGWEHWIMAPLEFDVYYCDGSCLSPMPDRLNVTNHAIVQGLIHSVKPAAAPPPCCVPTEMEPISLLYLNEYDKVQLKSYDKMAVIGCGCR